MVEGDLNLGLSPRVPPQPPASPPPLFSVHCFMFPISLAWIILGWLSSVLAGSNRGLKNFVLIMPSHIY